MSEIRIERVSENLIWFGSCLYAHNATVSIDAEGAMVIINLPTDARSFLDTLKGERATDDKFDTVIVGNVHFSVALTQEGK